MAEVQEQFNLPSGLGLEQYETLRAQVLDSWPRMGGRTLPLHMAMRRSRRACRCRENHSSKKHPHICHPHPPPQVAQLRREVRTPPLAVKSNPAEAKPASEGGDVASLRCCLRSTCKLLACRAHPHRRDPHTLLVALL